MNNPFLFTIYTQTIGGKTGLAALLEALVSFAAGAPATALHRLSVNCGFSESGIQLSVAGSCDVRDGAVLGWPVCLLILAADGVCFGATKESFNGPAGVLV